MPETLREIEAKLRAGGAVLTAARLHGEEPISLPVTDARGQESGTLELNLQVTNQRETTGFVTVYNTRTGEPIPVELNQIDMALKQRHRDPSYREWEGRYMFTLDSTAVPSYGQTGYRCPLNLDHPDRTRYADLGAQPCPKRNIPSLLAVEDHVRIKHQQTYRYMERARARDKEDEERQWRRFQMQQAGFLPMDGPTERVMVDEPVSYRPERTVQCGVCGEVFSAVNAGAAGSMLSRHMKAAHTEE